MEREIVTIRITRKSESWTWYNLGEEYPAVFDDLLGKYVTVGNGGASRLVKIGDCEKI